MSGALSDFLSDVLITPTRGIGYQSGSLLFPDCAIEETESHVAEITEHPIETGAAITDHVFQRPSEIRMRWAWSESSPQAGSTFSPLVEIFGSFSNGNQYTVGVYAQLQAMQRSRMLVRVMTSKSLFPSMLIQEISLTSNEETENALALEIVCREVILVTLQQASVPAQDVQGQPQQTSPVAPQGTQQAAPAAPTTQSSVLSNIFGGGSTVPAATLSAAKGY